MNLPALIEGGLLVVLCLEYGRHWFASRRQLRDDHLRYFDDSPDLLCTAGFDGYFHQVNAAFLRVLGYTQEEMCAQPFMAFVHESDKEMTMKASLKLSAGEGVTEFENRYLCKNGTWKWLMWNSKVDQARGLIFASAKDITKRKDLEDTLTVSRVALQKSLDDEKNTLTDLQAKAEALATSNRELASFAHVVAHDLQEPLRTITSYCAMLDENHKEALNADALEILSYITDASRRMKELIRDLLLYGRVDQRDLKLVCVSLMDVMTEVVAILKIAIAESHAHIIYDALPPVYADRRYMVQLLQNLVGNAIKYRGDSQPVIRITTHTDNDQLTISIHDNGIGIAPRHHQRIFGMFKRLHTREQYEGTGIGLALCKKITDVLNGKIWVESDIGQGATFHVTLMPAPHLQTALETVREDP